MQAMLKIRFGNNPRVSHLNLGDAVDLSRIDLAYDGMHLTEAGNRIIAQRLVEPVSNAVAARGR